jgi:hypothetical protein
MNLCGRLIGRRRVASWPPLEQFGSGNLGEFQQLSALSKRGRMSGVSIVSILLKIERCRSRSSQLPDQSGNDRSTFPQNIASPFKR